MSKKMLIGAAGLAVLVGVTAPAIAQYYPPPRQVNPDGLLGAIVNHYQYGRYPYGNYGYDRYGREGYAIDRCARAVEQRLNGYNYNWYQGNQYNRYRRGGRVEGITRVEQREKGRYKVWGVASSGYGGYQGWNRPGYGTYGYHAGADLRWDCKVSRKGSVSNVNIQRRQYNWRGY